MTDRGSTDSWTLIAALLGFLSGAGLMSHKDLIQVFSEDFYSFISVSNSGVLIYGRQMIEMLAGSVSYFCVLFLVAAGAIHTILRTKDNRVLWAGVGVFLLMISFIGITLNAVDRGYQPLRKQLHEVNLASEHQEEPLTVKWVWQ